MRPTIETKIWLALQSRIVDALPSVEKAWPGMAYAPRVGVPFIRVGRVYGQPNTMMVDPRATKQRAGTLVLTYVMPMTTGADRPDLANVSYIEQAALLAHSFQAGDSLQYDDVCVTITEPAHVQGGYQDDGWWSVPVTVQWRCFK